MNPGVLMLGWEFPPHLNGGLGVACEGLCRALARHLELTVILPRADSIPAISRVDFIGINQAPPLAPGESLTTVETFPGNLCPYADATYHPTFQGTLYGSDLSKKVTFYARASVHLAKGSRFDVIYAHDWMTALAGLEIKARTGKPFVFHIHSLGYDRAGPGNDSWIDALEMRAIEEADLVVTVSHHTRKIALTHYQADPQKTVTIHNGVAPIIPFRTPSPFPQKLILFLGRITGQKGPKVFVEIAHKVIKQNKNVRFAMAGTGDQLPEVMAQAGQLGILDHFHFTGFLNRNELQHLLSMTDVYCMPSVSEPFGLSALEAAQFGIPAVLSRQSGAAEVLTRSHLADWWDTDMMACHLVKLTTDSKHHQAAARAAMEDQKAVTWEYAAARLIEEFQMLWSSS